MGLFDDLIPDAPSSTGLFDDLLPKKGAAVADALKHDQDFQPTPEELSSGYKARMSLPDPGAIWKGAKTLATETLPAQMSKSWQQISAEGMPQPWDLAKSARQATVIGATLGETALRGTAYLGDMLKTPVDAAIGEAAAEAQSPGNAMLRAAQMALGTFSGLPIPVSQRTPEQQSAAEQIWASRMRVAGEDERAMAPYHEGDKTFVPGALGAPAEFASNFVDPTMAVPALKAAGLLKLAGKGAEAASMAGRLSNVAKEAANTGGVVKKAAEVAAPAIEKGAQLAGEGLDKVATGLDKVQPVLDVGGLVKGGLPGAAGAHVVGRGVRAGVKWASKVRDASTGVRNIAKADWNSTWTVAQQLAKDSDAPVWLRRAASSSVAPMVESTIRGAGAVGEGALHGAAIGGAASMANDTLTPEERGEFIGGGAVLGGGGAALGKGIGAVTGRNAQARQAHDWAVMAHEAIQSGAEPSTVLGASDATMSYAHSLKQLFKGAMPGGKDLTVRLMDGSQFAEAHPNEPTAVGSFVSSPDGTHEVRLNLDRPDADSRALHEGLGHALMESVVGNTPDAFERARAVFSPDEINTAAQQYATALHPELKGPDQQTWIAQQQANSTLRWGDRDAWILSELISEGAVQEAGGRSIRDMATPGFGSSLQRTLGRDKPFKVETASFFSGDVAAKLKSPELGQLVRGRVEQLGQFRPGIDEPKGNSVVVQKGDWGKKPFAPLHDLAKAPAQPPPLPRDPSQPPPLNPQPPTPAPQVPKGNDFVVVNPTTGAVVARPPAQTRKLVKNRQAAVDAAVPRDGTPASPGDVDPQVKFRTSPSGLVERAGTVLGKWFYDGNVFSETTKGYARKIEDAIKNGAALSGFYHEIGESARGWARSVGERYGNLTAEYKDFIPVGFLVSTAGNLLVRNYSLTAFERKAQTWGARKGALSLELWNGDVGTFKIDVQTYLKNHSEGRPGADGIGEQKRNVINAFLVGGNRSFEATNPLRPFAKGADREGIIRSYRLDRLETVEPSDITGFSQPKYEQQLRNLSPKTEQFSPAPQTDTSEFKKWFKASKVVDVSGAPVPVYHSSDSSGFTVFKKSPKDVGMHFGTPEQAEDRFKLKNKDRYFGHPNGQTIVPAFLSVQNPIRLPDLGEWNVKTIGRTLGELGIQVPENVKTVPQMRQFLQSRGYDGIVYKNIGELGPKWSGRAERLKNARSHAFAKLEVAAGNRLNKKGWASDPVIRQLPEFAAWDRADAAYSKFRNEHAEDSWAVFDPAQIKSSIANQGTFDPKNPDIRFSPKTLSEETISSTLPRNEEDTSRRLPIGRFRVDPATDGQTFAEAIRRTKTEHPFGFAVDDKGDGFYGDTGSKLFLAQDKLAGVAVTDYGDLVSVFKHPESTADIRPILAEASQHALTLDAFDVNGFLPNLYAQFGFRPVARVAFNREFAPPGWRYDLAGEPDVVLMVKDPKGISGAPAVSKDYSTVKTQVPSVDYDTAVRLQAEAKARVAAQVQFSPGIPQRKEINPSYLPENEREDIDGWMSTAVPTSKDRKGLEISQDLVVTGDGYFKALNPDQQKKLRDIIAGYPGMGDLPKDPAQAVSEFKKRGVENVLAIWDATPDDIRSRSKLWYVGGRAIVDRFSKQYGVTTQQAAAAIAALSPQKGWQENVRMAEMMLDAVKNLSDKQTTPRQIAYLKAMAHAASEVKSGKAEAQAQVLEKQVVRFSNPANKAKAQEKAAKLRSQASREKAQADITAAVIDEMEGKTFGQLKSDLARAMWIRSWFDGNVRDKKTPDITPEGDILPVSAVTETGKPVTLRWQGYGPLKKVLQALKDDSRSSISKVLGGAHKVRNFYNNLLLPNLREMQDVTVDTHAVAAALFRGLGAADPEIGFALGGSPSGGDFSGNYGLYADMYREAAEARNALPREMQSVTWEAIRNLMTRSFKSRTKDQLAAIWKSVETGELTREQARKRIIAAAGGWKPPSWYNHPRGSESHGAPREP